MRFLTAIVDALVGFVQRNPLTVLILVVLALAAPTFMRGVAAFILYAIMSVVILVIVLLLLFRWRIYRLRRQMEQEFDSDFGNTASGTSFWGRQRTPREGEVKVYTTSETPEKRVSSDVGDYVEFEETKEPKGGESPE